MTNDIKLDICCVMSCKLYNIRKFAMLIEIYFTIAKFAILRGIYFTIATFAKVRSQKQYSQLRYSQFNRVTHIYPYYIQFRKELTRYKLLSFDTSTPRQPSFCSPFQLQSKPAMSLLTSDEGNLPFTSNKILHLQNNLFVELDKSTTNLQGSITK